MEDGSEIERSQLTFKVTAVSKDILPRSQSSFQVLWNPTSGGDQARIPEKKSKIMQGKGVKAHFFFPIVHRLSLTLTFTHEHWRECSYFFRKSKSWWSEQMPGSRLGVSEALSYWLQGCWRRWGDDGELLQSFTTADYQQFQKPPPTTPYKQRWRQVGKMRSWRSTFV